jgi:hypothetical protein
LAAGMERKDWLALCAVHSDAWLMALVFFYAARFADDGRWAAAAGAGRGRGAPAAACKPLLQWWRCADCIRTSQSTSAWVPRRRPIRMQPVRG